MKKLMGLALVSGGLMFALACTPVETADDAGTARADAGTTADSGNAGSDAAVGQDTGGSGGTWVAANYGKNCASDTDCPGGICFSLFANSDVQKTCFKTCDSTPDCADFPFNTSSASCIDNEAGAHICFLQSAQNGICGNAANAGCVQEYGLCLMDESGVGTCSRICDPEDAATCLSSGFDSVCGCQGSDSCTGPMITQGDGVCAPATSIGDSCGADQATASMIYCTDGQECSGATQTNPVGSCAEPSVDGGVGEDV